jgi:mycoredoxin
MPRLELYGTTWCTKSAVLRNHLQRNWVEFDDYNVEEDEMAAQRVMCLYEGKLKFPTVIYDRQHLKNPKIKELDEFLKTHDLL